MRPEPDSSSIRLPVTFDYRGGRRDNRKGTIITSIVVFVSAILLTVILASSENEVIIKILLIALIWVLVTFFIRFRLLHEQVYSDAYESLKEIDNIPEMSSFWNIYDIDSEYPYVCHFSNGLKGIFVRLEKDVVVGKDTDVLYRHFDAISEAYNVAGSVDINMCHIDYMDNVGNDPRMQALYDNLQDCENEDMKQAMMSIYANLQEEMSKNYSSFDVYLFTTKAKFDSLWYNVKSIVDKLLLGNYLSFKVLDIDGVRTTCMALFNLNEFSAIEACEKLTNTQRYKGIVPIRVEHYDGTVTELNKTQEQLRVEAAERAKLAAQAEMNKKKSKSKFKKAKTSASNSKVSSDKSKSSTQTGVSVEQSSTASVKPIEEATDIEEFDLFE